MVSWDVLRGTETTAFPQLSPPLAYHPALIHSQRRTA